MCSHRARGVMEVRRYASSLRSPEIGKRAQLWRLWKFDGAVCIVHCGPKWSRSLSLVLRRTTLRPHGWLAYRDLDYAVDSDFTGIRPHRTGTRCSSRAPGRMLTTDSLVGFVAEEIPPSGHPGLENVPALGAGSTDEEVLHRIRLTGVEHHHSGGTAAMGEVVDTEGRSFGVEGLRVVDASVLPGPVAGRPQTTPYAVAEQLAAAILAGLRVVTSRASDTFGSWTARRMYLDICVHLYTSNKDAGYTICDQDQPGASCMRHGGRLQQHHICDLTQERIETCTTFWLGHSTAPWNFTWRVLLADYSSLHALAGRKTSL
ncbi:uncharacterized protein MYCGRDRAFT_88592 [Zymoseptoria tritici IPO323]|uniref:Glucose-methanol-choline oxidoreductase C-terminal domain-containing protein n=1 Tax=Zymoseptoria tritici (strain CBS 115943 / IPO323) TaxID=336722 RepID=F9WXC0_ZYMTI|nr:uncharacterized protein MYCGRDRAFT_88592 [Zymoseptoria tritici IPO323]EGP92785.1 hypothetical protein MYCGRDRAFT_88592 [Zymoseptoria tritici IPO323]